MKRIHTPGPSSLVVSAALALCAILVLPACEKASDALKVEELNLADFPESAEDKPILKLGSTGSGDKRLLRLAPKQGLEQSLHFEMDGKINGAAMEMSMDMASKVTRVGADGTFDVRATIADMDMKAAGAPDDVGDMVKEMLKDLVLTWTFNERGDVEGQKITGGMAAMMDQSFAQLFLSLPKEKLGVGASWAVNDKITSGGMILNQQMRYTITGFRGTAVELDMQVSQRAKSQEIGGVATLESLESSGKGTLVIDTTKALPQTMKLDLRMKAKISAGGKSQSQDTSVRFHWTSR